jgi:hypothetical protein
VLESLVLSVLVAVTAMIFVGGVDTFERIRCGEQPNGAPHIDDALMEFARQDIAQLVEQRSGRNDDVMADAVLQKIGADAARNEGRDGTFVSRSSLTRRG